MYTGAGDGADESGHSRISQKARQLPLKSGKPLAITRNDDIVGYYLPAHRKRTEAERAALREAASRLQAMLAELGMSEDEIVEDFKRWRANRRNDEV